MEKITIGNFFVGFENPTLCVGFWKAFSYTKKSSFGKMKMATNHFINAIHDVSFMIGRFVQYG